MHLPGRQVDPKAVRRDLWRLSEWERLSRTTRGAATSEASRMLAVAHARERVRAVSTDAGFDLKHNSRRSPTAPSAPPRAPT